jgi:hypothetical protein
LRGAHPGTAGSEQGAVSVLAQPPVRARILDEVPEDFFDKTVAGVITVYGERETLLRRSWRQILKVLEHESGF